MRAALALLVLAAPLAACGAGPSLNAVAKAATSASSHGSEHVQFSGTVTAAGQKIVMNGTGDFQAKPTLGKAHIAMQAGGRQFTMDEVMKGSTIYLKSPILAATLPAGKTWIAVDLRKASTSLGISMSQLGQQDPTDVLSALKKVASVTKVGVETVDGVDTTHYRATLDLSKLPDGAKLKQLANVQYEPVDVWIDAQNELRRVTMNSSATSAGKTISMSMQMDLSAYGETVSVSVPNAHDTLDMANVGG